MKTSDPPSHANERVGYGSPPESTRFKKGVSGNPKGRPKGNLNVATAFAKALRERVVVTEHGQRKTITKLEAALKQLVNKAAAGDLRALRQLVELARDAETKQSLPNQEGTVLEQFDQDVIAGIVKRFSEPKEEKL
ncbi:MAG TPA: DUF5681 domain-containing protein [Candidatus Acidoferrales bacterium]|nr:DUF5681 domain-containing protein [Candidatus Acidoferrales bacterium]